MLRDKSRGGGEGYSVIMLHGQQVAERGSEGEDWAGSYGGDRFPIYSFKKNINMYLCLHVLIFDTYYFLKLYLGCDLVLPF